jgi:hypothetical protein
MVRERSRGIAGGATMIKNRKTFVTLGIALSTIAPAAAQLGEAEAYSVDYLPTPPGAVLEVGGMDFLSDGSLIVSTRRGQVWKVTEPLAANPSHASFELFAEGLDEGLGLAVLRQPEHLSREAIYVLQRGELSRLWDGYSYAERDGVCDRIESLNSEWGLSGNYHEFAFGLPADDQGRLYATLNVSFFSPKWWHGKSPVAYRGLGRALRASTRPRNTRSWTMHPVAPGFRSPCGLGRNSAGDIFVTDNQGDWMPAGPIFHLVEGRFYGHPAGLDWTPSGSATARTRATPSRPTCPARRPRCGCPTSGRARRATWSRTTRAASSAPSAARCSWPS